MMWLYGIQSGLFIKIGISRDIRRRLLEMNLCNPHPCKVVIRRRLEEAGKVERRMHSVLAPYSVGREWFMVDVKLAKAALKVVIEEVRGERIAWQIECAQREEEKRRRASARGIHGERKRPRSARTRKYVYGQTLTEAAS